MPTTRYIRNLTVGATLGASIVLAGCGVSSQSYTAEAATPRTTQVVSTSPEIPVAAHPASVSPGRLVRTHDVVSGVPDGVDDVFAYYAPAMTGDPWCTAFADPTQEWAAFYDFVTRDAEAWRTDGAGMFQLVATETVPFCAPAVDEFMERSMPDGHELAWIDGSAHVCEESDPARCWAYTGGELADAIGHPFHFDQICAGDECMAWEAVWAQAGTAAD